MNRQEELMYVSKHPENYLNVQVRTLDQRLESVKLTEEEARQISTSNTKKVIKDKGISFLGPVGQVVSAVLEWNENINNDMTEAKKANLLCQYFDKTDTLNNSLDELRSLLLSPQGNTLFNKILRLLEDSPPDRELTDHLATVLKNVVKKGNFESLFEKHRYALGQIEKLTPQALTIISNYKEWPLIHLNTSVSFGAKVTSDFYTEFTQAYSEKKGIHNQDIIARIQHSVIEIQRLGLMEAFKVETKNKTKCRLTDIGEDLLTYIA